MRFLRAFLFLSFVVLAPAADETTTTTEGPSGTSAATSVEGSTGATPVSDASPASPDSTVITSPASPGTGPTTTNVTTEPLNLQTFAMSNTQPSFDPKLVLQQAVQLNQQILNLTQQLNQMRADLNSTNSPLFANLTQMATTTNSYNTTLNYYINVLTDQNATQSSLESNISSVDSVFLCFANSNCVTDTPTTPLSTTSAAPVSCPSDPPKATADFQAFNVPSHTNYDCSNVLTSDDNTRIVFNVSITVAGIAFLQIIDRTNYTFQTLNETGVTNFNLTSPVTLKYVSVPPSGQIGFDVYYSQWSPCDDLVMQCKENDQNATCVVSVSGQPRCQCSSVCRTGDLCNTSAPDPCSIRAKAACKESSEDGKCVLDECRTDACAYRCLCANPDSDSSGLNCLTKTGGESIPTAAPPCLATTLWTTMGTTKPTTTKEAAGTTVSTVTGGPTGSTTPGGTPNSSATTPTVGTTTSSGEVTSTTVSPTTPEVGTSTAT